MVARRRASDNPQDAQNITSRKRAPLCISDYIVDGDWQRAFRDGLTARELGVAVAVRKLQTGPHGGCTASDDTLGAWAMVSARGVRKIVSKLVRLKWIESKGATSARVLQYLSDTNSGTPVPKLPLTQVLQYLSAQEPEGQEPETTAVEDANLAGKTPEIPSEMFENATLRYCSTASLGTVVPHKKIEEEEKESSRDSHKLQTILLPDAAYAASEEGDVQELMSQWKEKKKEQVVIHNVHAFASLTQDEKRPNIDGWSHLNLSEVEHKLIEIGENPFDYEDILEKGYITFVELDIRMTEIEERNKPKPPLPLISPNNVHAFASLTQDAKRPQTLLEPQPGDDRPMAPPLRTKEAHTVAPTGGAAARRPSVTARIGGGLPLSDQDIYNLECANRLRDIITAHTGNAKPWRPSAWAKEINALCKQLGENAPSRIASVLDWYSGAIGGEFVPVAHCAKSFREKWDKLESQANRKAKPASAATCAESAAIVDNLKTLAWNSESLRQLPQAVCETLATIKYVKKQLTEILPRVNDSDAVYVAEKILKKIGTSPEWFVENHFKVKRESMMKWEQWGGSLKSFTLRQGTKEYEQFIEGMVRSWTTADGARLSSRIEKINCLLTHKDEVAA